MSILTPGAILSAAFRISTRHFVSIIGATILWLSTIWIPYLNVGTTIAMFSLITKIGHGEYFSPLEVFDSQYRKNMGEFLLLFGLVSMGILGGLVFGVIPGIVLYFAWSQSFLLIGARHKSPLEAITTSNRITYGEKWNMFLGMFLLHIIIGSIFGLLGMLFQRIDLLTTLVSITGSIVSFILTISAFSYIYAELEQKEFNQDTNTTSYTTSLPT